MELLQQQAQEELYSFPYHYLPYFAFDGVPRVARVSPWGLDYLTWTSVVLDLIRSLSPQSILDVGCGDGRLLGLLGDAVPTRVGLDASERAIRFARAFHPEIEWHVGHINCLSRSFECVTLIEVLEHIPDQEVSQFLLAVKRVVAVHGHLIISVPTVNVPLNPKHFRHYTLALLVDQIGGDFAADRVQYVCRLSRSAQLLKRFVVNRLWILNSSLVWSWIWRVYKRTSYWADSENGSHLILVARKLGS